MLQTACAVSYPCLCRTAESQLCVQYAPAFEGTPGYSVLSDCCARLIPAVTTKRQTLGDRGTQSQRTPKELAQLPNDDAYQTHALCE